MKKNKKKKNNKEKKDKEKINDPQPTETGDKQDNKNNNLNQENATNLFLPSSINKNNDNDNNKLNDLNQGGDNKNESNKNIVEANNPEDAPQKDSSANLQNVDAPDEKNKKKEKKKKTKKNINKEINELNDVKNNDNTNNKPKKKKKIVPKTINELEDRRVPQFTKGGRKNLPPLYVFCIFRRKAYPLSVKVNSPVKNMFIKLSQELNIEKEFLEFRINDRIITNEEGEKLIKDLVGEEKNDKIYVTKIFPNYNMINNLYNKTYNNIVVIENPVEIDDIEQKMSKILEAYHMEKDFYFRKINNNKYSFGFSCADLAFDFSRILILLKRTEDDYKNIKYHLKLEKRVRCNTKGDISSRQTNKNRSGGAITLPYLSYDRDKDK